MRKINGKAFLLLLIGTVLAAGGFWGLYVYQQGRIGEALRWQARHAEEEGDNARAARYLQRYLEFNPRDNTERANLAKLWVGDGTAGTPRQRFRAMQLMDTALLSEDDTELRKLLVKTAIGLREFSMARRHLNKLLPEEAVTNATVIESDYHADQLLPKDKRKGLALREDMLKPAPARGELEAYWGVLFEDDKKREQAQSCYRLAMMHAPEFLPGYVGLAYSLRRSPEEKPTRRQQNHQQADAALDLMVKNNASSYEAYLSRWSYRRKFDIVSLREKAENGTIPLSIAADDVTQALKRNPESLEVLLAAIDLERLRGRAASDDPALSQGQREAGLKTHRNKAFEYIERGLKLARARKGLSPQESGEFTLLWHQGSLLLDGLDIEPGKGDALAPGLAAKKNEIEALIAQIQKVGIVGASAYMRGRLALHERRWADAAAQFEQAQAALAGQPDLASQADLFLGQCYERLEQPAQMYAAYKRVADWDPHSVAAHMGKAAALIQQGQFKQANDEFTALRRQGQVPPRAWIDVVRLEIQRQLQEPKPNWANAEVALNQAALFNRNATVEVALLRAELFVRQKKEAEAEGVLVRACDTSPPDEAELWTALAELAVKRNKPEEARSTLEKARKKLGDKVPLRLALARLTLHTLKPDQARSVLHNEFANWSERSKYDEGDKARLLGGLADIALRARDTKTARKLWAEMAKLPRYATDLRMQRLLFSAALTEGDRTGMQEALDAIKKIEKEEGSYYRYSVALRAIWECRETKEDAKRSAFLEEARRELDALATARPSWAPLFLARSEVSELSGMPEQAIKDLEDASSNGDNSPALIRRLITLLLKKGDNKKASDYLARLPKAAIQAGLRNEAVAVYIRRGEMIKALNTTLDSIKENTQAPDELVFLARVLSANGKHEEAEQKINEAIRFGAGAAGPWIARVEFLVERKRKADALAAIAKAEKEIEPKQRPLALARCYELVNRPDKARACYEDALKVGKDDPAVVRTVASAHLANRRHALAEPLLRRLADGSLKATQADRDWARRGLAVVLASSTDYKRFTEALELVGLKLDKNGKLPKVDATNKPTDLVRAQARVLASQGQQQFRQQALILLEALDKREALVPDDKFLLAVLYEAEGERGRSQQRLRELTQPTLRTPRYLAQYASGLVNNKRAPSDLKEAELVIKLLEELEKQREVGPNGFASVELRARVLEAQGKKDDALALMKAHVSRPGARPEEMVLLVNAMTRQKRFADAYALCEQMWKDEKLAPELLAGISTSLLQVMKPEDRQVAAVEKRLRKAMEAKPSVMLKLQLADLLDRRGDYVEAAKLYKEVLKKEPNNFVALNNLAWMLAHGGGDAKQALDHVNKALAGMGRRADLLDTRGLIYLALKEPAKAVEDLKEAAGDGKSPHRLFHLARAYHANRDKDAARDTLKRARDNGLEVASLHPVEQKAAQELLKEYGR
jgi:Tfp pilus assembly protein PilF